MKPSFTKEEIDRFRADAIGIAANDNAETIHFNNAGASLMPKPVFDGLLEYLKVEAVLGGYNTLDKYRPALEQAYVSTAQLINADPSEIAMTESATVGWRMVFNAIDFKPGDVILTADVSYGSNYIAYLQAQKYKGIEIKVIPIDVNGLVDLAALESMIDERVKLIGITHIPTNGGLVNPAEAIGKIARKHGVLYLLDACQSLGQYPLDVEKLQCDFLTGTGRKYLRAPRGTGMLYVRQSALDKIQEPDFLDLASATWTKADQYEVNPTARRFEMFECNYASRYGFAKAVDYALEIGMDRIWQQIRYNAALLRSKLKAVKGVQLHAKGGDQAGLVTFSVEGHQAETLQKYLFDRHIHISTSWASGTLLDMEARGLAVVSRASVHYFNTEEEMDFFCQTLTAMIEGKDFRWHDEVVKGLMHIPGIS